MKRGVSFRFNQDCMGEQSSYLRTVLGFLCPASLLMVMHGSSEDGDTFQHERAHFQQLVSTPFGIALAILDRVCCSNLGRVLRSVHEAGLRILRIPLALDYPDNLPEEYEPHMDVLGQALSIKLVHFSWLLDKLPDNETREVPHGLDVALGDICGAIEHFCQGLGGKVTSRCRPGLTAAPLLPVIGRRVVTGRWVLENSATAEALMPAPGLRQQPEELVRKALRQTRKPYEYLFLLKSAAQVVPEKVPSVGFLGGFVTLCDLSCFGSLLPGMPGYGAERDWRGLHPAWRFVRLLEVLGRKSRLRQKLFSTSFRLHQDACDDLCWNLGWPIWSELFDTMNFRWLSEVEAEVAWIGTKFCKALEYRRRNHGVLMPSFLELWSYVYEHQHEYTGEESPSDYILRLFAKREEERMWLSPAVMVERGKVLYTSEREGIGSSIATYLQSYFSERIVLHESLDYPIRLVSHRKLGDLLEQWWGFHPRQVFPNLGRGARGF